MTKIYFLSGTPFKSKAGKYFFSYDRENSCLNFIDTGLFFCTVLKVTEQAVFFEDKSNPPFNISQLQFSELEMNTALN